MDEEIKVQPEEIVEEQLKAGFLENLKLHKFKILGGILGVLVFIGAVFGAYKLGQRQVQPGPRPTPVVEVTPTPDPTANWKAYTNTKYRYSVKYPEEWTILEGATVIFHPPGKTEIEPFFMFEIDVRENPTYLTPKAWFEKEYARLWEANISVSFEEVEVSGLKGEEVAFALADMPVRYILIGRENRIYLMNLIETSEIGSKEYQNTFNLMLSTFKFLEETAGEKVFCKEPRPEVCTMECIQNPPYICGSDGKSYCSECQACATPIVEWYIIQDTPCKP